MTSDRPLLARLRTGLSEQESIPPPMALVGIICGGVLLSEGFLYFGHLQLSLGSHLLTFAAGILVPVWLSGAGKSLENTVASVRVLALIPLFRLINLGMPVFLQPTVLWLPLVYGTFLPALYFTARLESALQFVSFENTIETLLLLPGAVGLGALLGGIDYVILSPEALVPSLAVKDMLLLAVVMIGVVGPVEEYLFRGLLQRAFQRQFGRWVGIAVASGLFGALHSIYGSAAELAFAAAVGLILGVLYDVTENLLLVAVVHGILNLFLFGVFPLVDPVILI